MGKENIESSFGWQGKVSTVMKVDRIPFLLEAASLQGRVKIDVLKSEGQDYELVNGKEIIKGVIPEGFAQVEVSTPGNNLSEFWNTYDALCEYNQPAPQA